MNIGQAIKKCRQLKHLTLDSLANKTGLSKSYLSLVESGKRQPSLDSLKKIAKVQKIPIELLIYLGAESIEIKEMDNALKKEFDRLILELIKNA